MRRPHVSTTALATLVLSLLFHLGAAAQLRWLLTDTFLFPHAQPTLTVILGLSATGAVAMCVVRRAVTFRVLLVTRFALLVVFGISLGGELGLQLSVLVPLLLEISVYEAWPWNLATGLGAVAASVFLQGIEALAVSDGFAGLLNYVAFGSILTLVASLGSRFREQMVRDRSQLRSLHDSVEEITRANVGYLDIASNAGKKSKLAERDRITRELHDTIGYTFTNLIMMMEAATDLAERDIDELKDTVQTARKQAEQGLAEVRRALYLLREQEEPPETGLATIAVMAKLFERATHVKVRIEFGNTPTSFGEEIDAALYHFVQEGLTNSFRHGNAHRVDVMFWWNGDGVTATVQDDGEGAPTVNEGIGIRGMRERFGKLGGTIEAGSLAGGFRLVAEVPIEAAGP